MQAGDARPACRLPCHGSATASTQMRADDEPMICTPGTEPAAFAEEGLALPAKASLRQMAWTPDGSMLTAAVAVRRISCAVFASVTTAVTHGARAGCGVSAGRAPAQLAGGGTEVRRRARQPRRGAVLAARSHGRGRRPAWWALTCKWQSRRHCSDHLFRQPVDGK